MKQGLSNTFELSNRDIKILQVAGAGRPIIPSCSLEITNMTQRNKPS